MKLFMLRDLWIRHFIHDRLFRIKMISSKIPEPTDDIKKLLICHPNTLHLQQLFHISP